ncbi:MAG: hypothetical protein ACRCYQ_13475 [Nocardioides sp.]
MNDNEIVRISWDSPPAFAELFDRYAVPIHRFASRRAGRMVAEPDALYESLRAEPGIDEGPSTEQRMLHHAAELLRSGLAPANLRNALFEAVKEIPGWTSPPIGRCSTGGSE